MNSHIEMIRKTAAKRLWGEWLTGAHALVTAYTMTCSLEPTTLFLAVACPKEASGPLFILTILRNKIFQDILYSIDNLSRIDY